jgi:acyl-coenzyme A synthetase/AMP-(fatty) acid ligase
MGQQVSASELEESMLYNKAVKECTVIGIAAELEGELPTAVVVLKPGAHATEEELMGFVNAKVADHKKLRYDVPQSLLLCFIF